MNPQDFAAQTDSIGPLLFRVIYPIIGLVAVFLAFLIYRRLRGRMGSGDSVRPSGGLDLVTLKKKGLLTPEELERVGQAMMRQMKDKDEAEQRKRGIKSADALMLDPEVRRLEIMAAARAKSEKQQQMATAELPATEPPLEPLQAQEQPVPPAPQPAVGPTEEELEGVELPLDVQQLVDSGLLSPEEVINVKRRLLERRRQQ